jgi:hypothetical protein
MITLLKQCLFVVDLTIAALINSNRNYIFLPTIINSKREIYGYDMSSLVKCNVFILIYSILIEIVFIGLVGSCSNSFENNRV